MINSAPERANNMQGLVRVQASNKEKLDNGSGKYLMGHCVTFTRGADSSIVVAAEGGGARGGGWAARSGSGWKRTEGCGIQKRSNMLNAPRGGRTGRAGWGVGGGDGQAKRRCARVAAAAARRGGGLGKCAARLSKPPSGQGSGNGARNEAGCKPDEARESIANIRKQETNLGTQRHLGSVTHERAHEPGTRHGGLRATGLMIIFLIDMVPVLRGCACSVGRGKSKRESSGDSRRF
ncbi:hypothetical protein B0H17DRAFT_1140158 [Mycena rosella]|uniref:Uncharacterized protein n=1 Tax=Mycena rosella TaxID=1033263 RepID=A0AAD7GBP5_MYCRO|nr:hypothetical protein B0H17DRAFT_1140158 [Mycena rosella]